MFRPNRLKKMLQTGSQPIGYDFVTPAADAWLLSDAARSIVTAMRG
ncbi:hypothetical protein [Chlorogloeopsis fritschii]|nr:hypothetical protein [Chlorogloeopsis fritschii]